MRRTLVSFAFVALAVSGCGPKEEKDEDEDPEAVLASVAIRFERGTGDEIDVIVRVLDSLGDPMDDVVPVLAVTSGAASVVANAGGGDYTSTVTPDRLDTEIRITATVDSLSATKIALPFTYLDASVGVPEAVPGLVNTVAWEDGINVSPDGQWLLVSSYLPLDALSCAFVGNSAAQPACQVLTGPTTAPERPGMLGSDRINGTSYDNECPSLGLTGTSFPFALLPTAAYGFRRQADGSFREPFVIGFDADGCAGPFGHSFAAAPAGTNAGIVFSWDDPVENGSSTGQIDIYYAPIALGSPAILGTFTHSAGVTTLSGDVTTRIPPVNPVRQGNPSIGGGRLWWDDEDFAAPDRELYFSTLTGTLPSVTASSAQVVGISMPGGEDIQPSMHGDTLYWMREGLIFRSVLSSGADPALAGSWGAAEELLGPESILQPILVAGEPTLAEIDGTRELYFVYIKRTATGYDANAGRVRLLD